MKKEKLDKPLLLRCECQSFEFIEVGWFDDKPKMFYFTLTCNPETWKDKIKGIWRILKGSNYGISDEVLLGKQEVTKLISWLQKRL